MDRLSARQVTRRLPPEHALANPERYADELRNTWLVAIGACLMAQTLYEATQRMPERDSGSPPVSAHNLF
jgi:hypothetical protein